jgi:hypothetical protein
LQVKRTSKKQALVDRLTDEEEAQLGLLVRALQDLFSELQMPASEYQLLPLLIETLLRGALARAKPNRRMSYLEQWRQFLCWLPGALVSHSADQRLKVAVEAIRSFHLQDRRGKTKPGSPFPQGANCLLMKDGQPWYAKVPDEDMLKKDIAEPPPKELLERFQAGEEIYESEVRTGSINAARAEYLLPFNPPCVLKTEYRKLISTLPSQDPPDENSVASAVTDVPLGLIETWIIEGGVSRNDLALLIAARRAKLTAKATNLSRLHEALHWAR